MIVIKEEKKAPIKAWIEGVELEESARQQLLNISSMPFIFKHVAVMPDVHWGMGSTVGSVIPTKKAIIPAAVGVDIGCGMYAVRTTLKASDLPDNLHTIRSSIEQAIPHGRSDDGGPNDKGRHKGARPPMSSFYGFDKISKKLNLIVEKHPYLERSSLTAPFHMGTLGTGNHFIEICLDQENMVWILLHSGSRGIGNAIGTYFINKAKKDMQRWFINLPDSDLAYFPEGSEFFDDYIQAVEWAQEFASYNRYTMMQEIIFAMHRYVKFSANVEAINCHHNYVTKENHFGENVWVTRKGAVSAREGQLGIIPGSMGAKSFIVRGKGNKDSFTSCSHGAGRRLGRNEAKRRFSLEDHIKATEGVECRKDEDVIDETPMAYKDIDKVMTAQSDLVEVVHTLKQIVCVKG